MNLFDLSAKITLDSKEYEKGISSAQKKTSDFKDKLGNGLKKGAKIGMTALAGASTAIVGLVTQSTKSYAEYEQLVGGVETLFKDSADTLMGYASTAYQTAGMSANDYMSTITSFSASMISSLGGDTAKATEYSNQAVTDMSDNANKMGTDLQSIVQTYQSLSRGNFGMLDNLKLGYGGTKAEMERLLADAEKLTGKKFDISNFADITEAIHAVQTEMGITGTTAEEATETIEGSALATKSAWDNLVAGLGDKNADVQGLISNLVTSAGNLMGNLLPILTQVLNGGLTLITTMMPEIVNQIPTIITEFLPNVIESAGSIITTLVQGLADNSELISTGMVDLMMMMVDMIIENLPSILSAGGQIVTELALGLINALPELIAKIPELVTGIVDELKAHKEDIKQAGKDILTAIKDGAIENWSNFASWLWEAAKSVFKKDDGGSDGSADGSHAGGLSYVPYDGYTAVLHKGERVLTAQENKGFGSGTTIVQNIYAQKQSASDLARTTIYQARKVAILGV